MSSKLSNRSPPSVIMIMLDAVSDLQARRALPQTLSYLKSQGLFTFQRHAIVGDGTFENIVPMLFGQSANDYQKANINDSRYEFIRTEIKIDSKTKKRYQIKKILHYPGPYDNYPFIMKNFSKLNYTTFFSEEWRESAFYNLKNGFRQSPTDFYLRPYWLSLYETMSYNKYAGNSNPKPCYLNKLLHFLSLDWLEQFLNIHHKTLDYPTFGIMKMNEMSHDYLERLFWVDYDFKNFFENLIQKNLLNNTILIFCGDHGHRQHRLRLTRIGSFEVKLPFFSMLLPQSFKQQFPQAVKNLKNNEQSMSIDLEKGENFLRWGGVCIPRMSHLCVTQHIQQTCCVFCLCDSVRNQLIYEP
jgi:membrane-anchored protein YejM (alkaline phosphatase superfamily)